MKYDQKRQSITLSHLSAHDVSSIMFLCGIYDPAWN